MRLREGGSRRIAAVIGVALCVGSAAWTLPRCSAQEGALSETAIGACPLPEPCLETPVGWSLFWQDPRGGGYRDSRRQCFQHRSLAPTWYVMAEYVPLFRDESDALPAVPLVDGGTLVLDTSEFDPEFAHGARLLVGLSLGDWYRLEVSSLGYHSWSDSVALATETEFAGMDFSSDMDTIELNLRRRLCVSRNRYVLGEASATVGVRYLRIDENLDYLARLETGDAATITSEAAVDVENDLFGVQLGGLIQVLVEDRAWVDFEIKGGIYANSADVAATYAVTPGEEASFAGEEDRTAFVGDLSLTLNYQFAPAWTFRAGYNSIWVTGVALASQNISADASLPLTNVDHSGRIVYHGPSIGLVWAR